MKQVITLLLLALLWYIGFYTYDVYWAKNYKSSYNRIKTSNQINIEEIQFDKEKINKIYEKIKELRQDPVFKLKLPNTTKVDSQPLFIDSYSKIYNKYLEQIRRDNIYSK